MAFLEKDSDYRAYRQSLLFLLIAAKERILPGRVMDVHQSVNRSTYCEIPGYVIREADIQALSKEMHRLIEENFPLKTISVPTDEAIRLLQESGDLTEAANLKSTPSSSMTLFETGGHYYSVYGPLLPHAGYVSDFELVAFESGLLLRYPHPALGGKMQPFHSGKKILQTISDYRAWSEVIGMQTVYDLNRAIRSGRISECINISEIMHEKCLSQIADIIKNDILQKKVILISGPSSSGKTTTANRLMLHLRANGISPQLISLDDYYLGRSKTPLDENGKPNYENIEAIDFALFNRQLLDLVDGKTVEVPRFDFTTGERAPSGRVLSLPSGSVLLVEGIHALNEKLTLGIPARTSFKIYCSALTVLGFDRYNPISPTDTRLIRRILRDSRFRNTDAIGTFDMWPDVQKGEIKNIFPYEDAADIIFNSALSYEFSVYRKPAEALLRNALSHPVHQQDAARLLDFIHYFDPIDAEFVPPTSILREFIGGSSILYS